MVTAPPPPPTAPLPPGSTARSEPDYRFDFCGGHVAIDFTNTVGSRGETPEEHLNTYGDLLAWAAARRVVGRTDAARLTRAAAADPEAARRALRRATELREAVYRVLLRQAAGRPPVPADLDIVNRFVADTFRGARLAPAESGFVLATDPGSTLEAPLAPVVRASVELLTSDLRTRVGTCAAKTCGWLFLDTTRNRTRRWCDMKVCGNRAKVRRFRGGEVDRATGDSRR